MSILGKVKAATNRIIRGTGFEIVRKTDPVHLFHSNDYLRHTARRLEHLATLKLPVAGMSALEVGAGIGDHSHYYMDRGCKVTMTDARTENLLYLKIYYPNCSIWYLDMDSPSCVEGAPFDVVHCYGLLYHLSKPQQALAFLSENTSRMLVLETCVSFGESEDINLTVEVQSDPTQSYSGTGCRPTRTWVFRELKGLFEYVYLPKTQPCHDEFPLDWSAPAKHKSRLQRAIFIASRQPLENEILTPSLILQQRRHE